MMLKKVVLTLLLAVFVSFTFVPGGSAIADNLNPAAMTYDGMVSPLEVIDVNVYKSVKVVVASSGYIAWSKAVDVDKQPSYIAVFVFMGRPIVITYYFDKEFYQVALPHNNSTHLEMKEKIDSQIQRFQADFINIFRVPFPLE